MCQHPNIIKLLDLFENSDYYYIVLEYMEGKDLFDYLKARNFSISEDRARHLAIQVAEAIQYLHSYGIVHRDIKLENVMMSDSTDKSVPKLVDFGLAKIIGPSEKTTEPFGTLGYVAPEVLKKEPYTFSCDLWSLGCIAYALLSGSLPFDHESQKETIRMTLHDPLVFDLPVWDSVSHSAKEFIEGLLAKNPNDRMTLKEALKHPWLLKHK
jgi:serine/threonine protein kinase